MNAPASAQGFELEEVVVTARKREENLQDTPVAITAFTHSDLELRQIHATQSLGDVTPNLTFDAVSPSSGSNSTASIFIRGIGQSDFTGITDPGVGLYIDGVYYARAVGSAMDFLDLDRVEILRGPQGTLFGRNTIGGAVVLHTKRPNMEQVEGDLKFETGTDDKIYINGNVNIPINERLAVKVSGSRQERDGYVTRITDGLDLGNDDTWSLRGSVLWQPNDSFEAYLTGDYSSEDENGAPTVSQGINETGLFGTLNNRTLIPSCPFFGSPGGPSGLDTGGAAGCVNSATADIGEFNSAGTFPAFSKLDAWGVTGTLTWDAAEWLTIKSISAYRNMDGSWSRDSDSTPFNIFQTNDIWDSWQFSQELQFTGLAFDDRLNWLLGAYYFEEETDNTNGVPIITGGLHSRALADNTSWAIFGQATYNLTDQLALTFGLRHTEDTKRFTPDQFYDSAPEPAVAAFFDIIAPPYVLGQVITPGGFFNVGDRIFPMVEGKQKFTDTTPYVNLAYTWNDDLMTYFTWSEGFKSGGFDQRFAAPRFDAVTGEQRPTRFTPETVSSFEVGLKSQWLDNKVRINAAGFITRYKDLQLVIREFFNPITFNGGTADLAGFEIETVIIPNLDFIITAAVGYIDASYDQLSDEVVNNPSPVLPGNKLVNTPEWSANIGAAYTFHTEFGTLTPRVDWSYRDDSFNDAVNSPRLFAPSYHLVNISMMFESNDEHWQAVVGGTNITDEVYLISGTSAFGTASGYTEAAFGRTAQWFLSLKYSYF